MRAAATHFGIPWPRYRLIAVAELAAAAGVLIGLWWHLLGPAAAAGLVAVEMASVTEVGIDLIVPAPATNRRLDPGITTAVS